MLHLLTLAYLWAKVSSGMTSLLRAQGTIKSSCSSRPACANFSLAIPVCCYSLLSSPLPSPFLLSPSLLPSLLSCLPSLLPPPHLPSLLPPPHLPSLLPSPPLPSLLPLQRPPIRVQSAMRTKSSSRRNQRLDWPTSAVRISALP